MLDFSWLLRTSLSCGVLLNQLLMAVMFIRIRVNPKIWGTDYPPNPLTDSGFLIVVERSGFLFLIQPWKTAVVAGCVEWTACIGFFLRKNV